MDSSSSRLREQTRKQAELRAQIAVLQAQLTEMPQPQIAESISGARLSPKRKRSDNKVLAPPTPSPKKRRSNAKPVPGSSRTSKPSISPSALIQPLSLKPQTPVKTPISLPPSGMLTKLASLNTKQPTGPEETLVRSSGFSERPKTPPIKNDSLEGEPTLPRRDDRLALVEDLELGPVEHTPPFDDPLFEHLEPNSGIRLNSREILYEDLQDHLRARYYLSPSKLYSVIRLLPNKQGYDVPVEGDWVTIAVVAERGPVKFTKAPVTVSLDQDGDSKPVDPNDTNGKGKGKAKSSHGNYRSKKDEQPKHQGKKYINFKLVDFGARSSASSAAKAVIRGDAFLSLLLFEADSYDTVVVDDDDEGGSKKTRKVYKGGSRGAFEDMALLAPGDVVALLNSKILKPFQRSNDSPHPTNNILALTPESSASIALIGRAKDLGKCRATKRDGSECGSWCDLRLNNVCEWHIQNAIQARRAGRAEFSVGTSGMSRTSIPGTKRKPAEYDPTRQWGLKPTHSPTAGGDQGNATYVVSGHIVGSSYGPDPRSIHMAENIGREGQAKAKRKSVGREADRALKVLLERDKEGMRTVVAAREAAKLIIGEEKGKKEQGKGKGKKEKKGDGEAKRKEYTKGEGDGEERPRKKRAVEGDDGSVVAAMGDEPLARKNAYSAEVVKQLGFDPIAKAGQHRLSDVAIQEKLKSLADLQQARKGRVSLGSRPGEKIRSGVVAPQTKVTSSATPNSTESSTPPEKDADGATVDLPSLTAGPSSAQFVDLDD